MFRYIIEIDDHDEGISSAEVAEIITLTAKEFGADINEGRALHRGYQITWREELEASK